MEVPERLAIFSRSHASAFQCHQACWLHSRAACEPCPRHHQNDRIPSSRRQADSTLRSNASQVPRCGIPFADSARWPKAWLDQQAPRDAHGSVHPQARGDGAVRRTDLRLVQRESQSPWCAADRCTCCECPLRNHAPHQRAPSAISQQPLCRRNLAHRAGARNHPLETWRRLAARAACQHHPTDQAFALQIPRVCCCRARFPHCVPIDQA